MGPKSGFCCVCGSKIEMYDSHWYETGTGNLYCDAPGEGHPSPIGPCYTVAKKRWEEKNAMEIERLMLRTGLSYYTDG